MDEQPLRPVRRVARAVVALAGAGLLLAACSSSPPRSSTTTTSSSTSTTSTTTSTSTTTTSASAVPCPSSSLQLAADSAKSTAGAGSTYLAYTLTNTGTVACSLDGFPDVAFYAPGSGGSGTKLALSTVHSGAGAANVVLAAGAAGAFYLVAGDVPVGGVGCATVSSISVTPPGGSAALTLAVSLDPCGPSVGVTAVVPAASLST